MKANIHLHTIVAVTLAILLSSCRGEPFKKPPIHPNLNMDQQKRMEAQEKNDFFADNRVNRQPVDGTVPRGHLKADDQYYRGKTADGSFVEDNPVEITKSFLYRGKEQYRIYCEPCHGGTGAGNGIIMTGGYGYVPAPSYHIDRIREMPDGQLYDAIANGVRNMPSYATQVEVKDRWAIVSYIRALQLSQNASEDLITKFEGVSIDELKDQYAQQQDEEAEQEAAKPKGGGEVSVEKGKQLYEANACQTCHSRDGSQSTGPTHQGIWERTETLESGETITVDEEYLRESIVNPNTKMVKGYMPVMPSYGSMLSDSDIQSLIEYMKTL